MFTNGTRDATGKMNHDSKYQGCISIGRGIRSTGSIGITKESLVNPILEPRNDSGAFIRKNIVRSKIIELRGMAAVL